MIFLKKLNRITIALIKTHCCFSKKCFTYLYKWLVRVQIFKKCQKMSDAKNLRFIWERIDTDGYRLSDYKIFQLTLHSKTTNSKQVPTETELKVFKQTITRNRKVENCSNILCILTMKYLKSKNSLVALPHKLDRLAGAMV